MNIIMCCEDFSNVNYIITDTFIVRLQEIYKQLVKLNKALFSL